MTTQLALQRFDVGKTDEKRVIVIIGKRNSGKSQMTADWLFHKRKMSAGVLMSSTEEATGFFKSVIGIPDTYVYGEWDGNVIDTIIAKQRKHAKAGTLRNCFIVLDDLAFDKKIFSSKQMRELLFNGRHYGIMLIITAQFLGDLPTFFRSNVDYVVTYRTPGIQDRERLYRNFFGVIPSFHMFQSIMDATTENYSGQTIQIGSIPPCSHPNTFSPPFSSDLGQHRAIQRAWRLYFLVQGSSPNANVRQLQDRVPSLPHLCASPRQEGRCLT